MTVTTLPDINQTGYNGGAGLTTTGDTKNLVIDGLNIGLYEVVGLISLIVLLSVLLYLKFTGQKLFGMG